MSPSTEARVIRAIEAICNDKGLGPQSLTKDTVLDRTLGLESLDYAELVIRLEDEFGVDPFNGTEVPAVRTIGDLAQLYPN